MTALRNDRIRERSAAQKRRRNFPHAAERFAVFAVPAAPLDAGDRVEIEARIGAFSIESQGAAVSHARLSEQVAALGDGAQLAIPWGCYAAPGTDNEFDALADRAALARAMLDHRFLQAVPAMRIADPVTGAALHYFLAQDEYDEGRDEIYVQRPVRGNAGGGA